MKVFVLTQEYLQQRWHCWSLAGSNSIHTKNKETKGLVISFADPEPSGSDNLLVPGNEILVHEFLLFVKDCLVSLTGLFQNFNSKISFQIFFL